MTFSVKISFQGGLRDVNEVILRGETKLRNQIDIFFKNILNFEPRRKGGYSQFQPFLGKQLLAFYVLLQKLQETQDRKDSLDFFDDLVCSPWWSCFLYPAKCKQPKLISRAHIWMSNHERDSN